MLRDYEDITKRISDPILWWDDNGVPRYDKFSPSMGGVYDDVSLLIEISCQGCDRLLQVSITSDVMRRMVQRNPGVFLDIANHAAVYEAFKEPFYGDPPRHDDHMGETMTSDTVRIIEFWIRDYNIQDEDYVDTRGWHRHTEFEGPLKGESDERASTD